MGRVWVGVNLMWCQLSCVVRPRSGHELTGRDCLCCEILESWEKIPGKNLAWLTFLFIKNSHKRNDGGLGPIFGCLFSPTSPYSQIAFGTEDYC
jgi:hypothetical protein